MTLHELSQLRYLQREIELDKERLAKLRALAESPSASNFTGMPGGGENENRLERYVAEIDELETMISCKIAQCISECRRLERYITDIPDSFTRQIFTLRFVEGYSWQKVAMETGGGNIGKTVSNICYRYIKKRGEETRGI